MSFVLTCVCTYRTADVTRTFLSDGKMDVDWAYYYESHACLLIFKKKDNINRYIFSNYCYDPYEYKLFKQNKFTDAIAQQCRFSM